MSSYETKLNGLKNPMKESHRKKAPCHIRGYPKPLCKIIKKKTRSALLHIPFKFLPHLKETFTGNCKLCFLKVIGQEDDAAAISGPVPLSLQADTKLLAIQCMLIF